MILTQNKEMQLHLLASRNLGLTILLDTDSLDLDESSRVRDIQASELVHAALLHRVEVAGLGRTAKDVELALVDTATNLAVDSLLGGDNGVLEELPLGREVEAVVENLGVADSDELVTESTDLTVQDKTLKINVSGAEDGQAGSLVAATGLDANEAVLDNVDTADTVLTGNGVGSEEEIHGLGVGAGGSLELDGDTLLEGDGEVLGGVGGVGGVDSELPHVLGRSDIGILEDTGLVGAVGHVLIHRPWLGLGLGDWDTLLCSVVEEVVAALEALVELGHPPWSNNLNVGLQGIVAKLETDLVVTLASAAVRDGKAALLLGNGNLTASNDGTGERGTKEVDVLVDGIALDGGEAKLLDELLLEVNNVNGASTD